MPPADALRDAAVLVPLFRDAGGALRLVLVRRGDFGPHGGQLAFPGGKPFPGEPLEATALREAHEETGLAPSAVTIFHTLPPIETWTTGFRIVPFLAHIIPPAVWRPEPGEIAEVLTPRLADLAAPDAHTDEVMQFAHWPGPRRVPYYRVGPYKLWGATYRIFHPLLPRLLSGEWPV